MQQFLLPKSLTARPFRESPEVKLANLTTSSCPSLRTAEAILQSIIRALTPHRQYKKLTLTLAQQAVNVTAQITTLIEATKEAPQWPKHIAHLEEVLHETRLFIQAETQRSVLHRALRLVTLVGKTIPIRYTEIEQRLNSILDHSEQCHTEIRAGISMSGVSVKADPISSARFQALSSNLTNSADVVRSGEMFPNAHDFMITGGQYYSGQISIHHASSQESGQGIVPGLRVIAFEDISINREVYRTRMYRLHSDNGSGRARLIKVYHGPRAKERAQETARFHKKVMHPTILHIIGVSPLNCEVPFLVFNGGFEGSLEASITKALEIDLRKSIILGLRTVIGLSSGLDYLRDVAYPFVNAGSQHFRAFLNLDEEVIISFDPDIAYEHFESVDEHSSFFEVDKPLLIFHKLCQQTFDAACQAHYEKQQVRRTFADTLETEDMTFFSYGASDEGLQRTASASTSSSGNVSSEELRALARLPTRPENCHRRELVWKSQDEKNSSLEDIYFDFKTFLDSLLPSSEPALHRRRGRYTVRTVHRCPGYNRTEITLTPSITRSAIVSHSTPLPNEICPVCNRVVQDDVEMFDCICGGEDDESEPTIQCSKCRKWHHRHCVGSLESTTRSFTCPNCSHTKPGGESSHVIKRPKILPLVQEAPSSFVELNRADIDETILKYRESLYLCPTFHPNRLPSLDNLAHVLWDRFHLTGSMTDLEESISLYRESLSLCPSPHPNRSMSLNNLANALRDRFQQSGSLNDLGEAISLHRESIYLRPSSHPDRSKSPTALQMHFRIVFSSRAQ